MGFLHTLDDDGNMAWICPDCKQERTAHVSHEQIEHPAIDEIETVQEGQTVDENGHLHTHLITRPTGKKVVHDDTVALPPCACGARSFLRVKFSSEELQAPNMLDEDGKPTASHKVAHRHMALVNHMRNAGKTLPN